MTGGASLPIPPRSLNARPLRVSGREPADERVLVLDARNTHITFTVALGPMAVRGAFGELRGRLSLSGHDMQRAEITLDVVAGSVDTGFRIRDEHLRGASFLDVARFPLISYQGERVRGEAASLRLDGTLSLRGVEQRVVASCHFPDVADDIRDADLPLRVTFEIQRADFGVGVPRGFDVVNPMFLAIGRVVHLRVDVTVPPNFLNPALLPFLAR